MKSVSFAKYGHATYEVLAPPRRYLTMRSSQSFSGGCPESGPLGVSGNKTVTIDPETGESSTTGDGFVNTGGTIQSPVRRGGSSSISSYDDPPNSKGDCTGTINYTTTLASENTTEMMVSNGKSQLEDYENDFQPGTPYAYRNVHQNELSFAYQKAQFKFKWKDGTTEEQKFPIKYLLLFQPEDNPETPENESIENAEILNTPAIEWDGQGTESPIIELDPDSLKQGVDGSYRLLPFDLTSDLNNDGEINHSDESLESAAEKSGASNEDIEKGTEYLFANDNLSNGLWDVDDSDPDKPQNHTDDDDINALKVVLQVNFDDAWFEFNGTKPNGGGVLDMGDWELRFYKDKAFTDEILWPLDMSTASENEAEIYVRAEGTVAQQVEGDLSFVFGKFSENKEHGRDTIKFTVVKQLGDEKYFHAAHDYVFENNTKNYRSDWENGSHVYRVISMIESQTSMDILYSEPEQIKLIDDAVQARQDFDVILNGNQYFDASPYTFADHCHGRLVSNANLFVPPSDDRVADPGSPLAGPLGAFIGQTSSGEFVLHGGIVPNPGYKSAMGGLSTNYGERASTRSQLVGLATLEQSGKIIFSATQINGSGGVPDLKADAVASGVASSLNGEDPSLNGRGVNLLALDGSSSVAVAYRDPSGSLGVGHDTNPGLRHSSGIPRVYVNNYLLFKSTQPRP